MIESLIAAYILTGIMVAFAYALLIEPFGPSIVKSFIIVWTWPFLLVVLTVVYVYDNYERGKY